MNDLINIKFSFQLLVESNRMKVFGVKNKKSTFLDDKSQRTTEITSNNHSRKNSLYSLLSKYSQASSTQPNKIPGPVTARQKRKYMNITVKQNRNGNAETQQALKSIKQKTSFRFKFCQQIPINQNFYSRIISQKQKPFHQESTKNQIQQQYQQLHKHVRHNSTLTALQSPIIKLIDLQKQQKTKIRPIKQFQIELQHLMDRL